MARAYDILRKLENGELLPIASRSDLAEARKLAESLYLYWPAEYVVRESTSERERPADPPEGAPKSGYTM
jgi:hypothetical protein